MLNNGSYDPTDVAFLAIGATRTLDKYLSADKERPSTLDGVGEGGIISDIIEAAPLLYEAWNEQTDFIGVWYYEVSEPLGMWLAEMYIAHGTVPEKRTIRQEIYRFIRAAQGESGCEKETG